ncbi:sensor histidine kinase, partial [Idiomarina xiamenensis]
LPAEAAPKELKAVIRVVNDAFQRLEKGFQIQQDMLATTAHELKTPLTLMRNEVEALDPIPARQLLLNDIDQLSRQVGQILHLSEARGVQNYQFIECDVVELADDVVRYLARLADSHQVQLQLQFNERIALVRADKGMLFVLLKNLVENAIYHAEPQTAVCIDLREHQHPDTEQHILTVSNKGPAITAEHRRLIFNKFWRGPERHHVGAGLGLSICQEIAEKHGWRLRVTNHATRTLFVLYSQPLRLKNQ